MKIVYFVYNDDSVKNYSDYAVIEFDAYENYDMLNEFFGAHDKSLMCSKEEYFEDFDYETWDDYVIVEDGKIISRAGIWKKSDAAWEVAGVSTLPEYRRKGYGERIVRYCAARITECGKVATCSTKESNTAMIKTALKAGFEITENM